MEENLWDSQIRSMRFTKFLVLIEAINDSNNCVPFVRCAPSSLGDIAVRSFGQNPWSQKGPFLRRYHARLRPSMEGKDLSPEQNFCTKWKFQSRATRRYAYYHQGVSEQKVPSVWTFFRQKICKISIDLILDSELLVHWTSFSNVSPRKQQFEQIMFRFEIVAWLRIS